MSDIELRAAPRKPDQKFWDNEARKLALLDHITYTAYATGSPNRNGAMGLGRLKFRRLYDYGTGGGVKGSQCPFVKLWGRRLINGCKRVWREDNG